MPYIGKTPTVGNFQVCDAISVVNGQAAYTLQVGGVNVAPESANHMLVSLNGILQKPGSSFTISGSTMTFASNLATGDVIDFVQILGNVLDLGQPSDDTVTAAKINNDVISGQTALTSAPDDTDELLISDAGTIKRIDVSLVGGKNTPMAAGYISSSQTVSDNTPTKVQFNAEYYDTDSAYDHSTNYRFTVPSGKGGKYFIHAAVYGFGNNNDEKELGLDIYKNGSVIRRQYMGNSGSSTGAPSSATITATTIADLSASDYIEFYAFVNVDSGTPAFFGNSTLTNIYSYFNIAKMID
jgi:hypothetical protein